MKKMAYWLLLACAISILHLSVQPSAANEYEKDHSGWLEEFGLLTGYGGASIVGGNYQLVLFMPRWGFDIKPATEKMGLKPPGHLEFVVEPLANVVVSPNTNTEVGCSFLLKYGLDLAHRFLVFAEGGLGMLYMTQHTVEQGTQYNFLPQGGAGVQYFFNKRWALTGSYRFRHLSNAGISSRNSGINTHLALVGISFFYK